LPVVDRPVDMARVRDFLRRDPVLNTVPLGLVNEWLAADAGKRPELFVAVVERGGEIVAAGVRSAIPQMSLAAGGDELELAELARIARPEMPDLPCVAGPQAQAEAFAGEWARITGKPHRPGMTELVHVLQQVRRPERVPGAVRRAGAADVELVLEWFRAFEYEAQPDSAEAIVEGFAERMRERVAAGAMFLWDAGSPVAMAGAREIGEGVARIGPVYTPPAHRRRGYAGAITAAASQAMLDEGCSSCCLFTDVNNPTSNHVYREIGYQPVADFREFWFRP
jgi:predicted GNAT family acetyltransferase